MLDGSFNHDANPPMIIDCFAGGGGASTGIERALGRSPDVAINHSEAALALHAANHPETIHLNSNIWDVNPRDVVGGRRVGLLWASPDCKHFSKAKGGAPRDRNVRDLAWVVLKWVEDVKLSERPDVILMENVEEFVTWGPIDNEGLPIKEFAGQTFNDWKLRFKRAGYKLDHKELRGCDYGAPTIRKRWFFVARRDGRPIVWPKPTHGDPKCAAVKSGKLLPWLTAAECIDWSLPCPSIFDTKAQIMEKHSLRAQRPLANNTLARVARGMKRYVLDAERPFLVNLTHGGRTEDLADPFRTITGAHRGEKALIAPSITRFNTGATGQDMRAPLSTVTANSWIKKPGGAAPLGIIAPTLMNVANSKTTGRGPNIWTPLEPLRTVTSSSGFGIIAPHIMTMRNAQKPFNGADAPCHTITAGGAGLTLVAPNLLSLKGTARRASGVDAPHPTVLAGGGHSAIIAPILTYAQQGGAVRSVTEPNHTITVSRKDQNALIVPLLVQAGYGEAKGQSPRCLDPHKPIGTIVAGGGKHAAAAAFLAQHNSARTGFNPGRPMSEPIATLTQTGSQQSLVAPWFAKYYGAGTGARSDEPCHTITVKDRMAHTQAELKAPPFQPEHENRARQVAEFLRAHGAWDDR
jgi:DNA (cytosine-5)-methyltransferase 1